jgi:hypothetical protein
MERINDVSSLGGDGGGNRAANLKAWEKRFESGAMDRLVETELNKMKKEQSQ